MGKPEKKPGEWKDRIKRVFSAWTGHPRKFLREGGVPLGLLLLALLLIDFLLEFPPYPLDILLLLAVAVALVVLFLRFWRCPACGERLPVRIENPRFLGMCPHCGAQLPED